MSTAKEEQVFDDASPSPPQTRLIRMSEDTPHAAPPLDTPPPADEYWVPYDQGWRVERSEVLRRVRDSDPLTASLKLGGNFFGGAFAVRRHAGAHSHVPPLHRRWSECCGRC